MIYHRFRLAGFLSLSVLLVACSGGVSGRELAPSAGPIVTSVVHDLSTTSTSTTPPSTASTTGAGATTLEDDADTITLAEVPEEAVTSQFVVGIGPHIDIYASAGATAVAYRLSNPGPFETGPRILELTGNTDGTRSEVVVPVKPNGTLGWVDLDAVSVRTSTSKITVSLSEKTATLEVGGDVIHVAAVAVGKDETPTPLLESIVDVLLVNANGTGPYGTHIFGTNQHSEVLDTFGGGRPAIAIHGTNKPELLGQAVSNGCVRMHNDDILIFSEHVELGTRVIVVE